MGWYEDLTETQQNEIKLARYWRDDLGTATPGANRLKLIAEMADTLDAGTTPPPYPPDTRFVMWDCDYQSQWDDDAKKTKKDCGPAAAETVCKYITGDQDGPGTDEIMKYITGGYDRSTSMTELQEAAWELYGVRLERHNKASMADLEGWIKARRPPILLVKYAYFVMRLDRNYRTGHFMVGVGWDVIESQNRTTDRYYLHDPDWWEPYRDQGAFLPVTRDHLYKMWDGAKDDRGPGWQNPARAALVPVRHDG